MFIFHMSVLILYMRNHTVHKRGNTANLGPCPGQLDDLPLNWSQTERATVYEPPLPNGTSLQGTSIVVLLCSTFISRVAPGICELWPQSSHSRHNGSHNQRNESRRSEPCEQTPFGSAPEDGRLVCLHTGVLVQAIDLARDLFGLTESGPKHANSRCVSSKTILFLINHVNVAL